MIEDLVRRIAATVPAVSGDSLTGFIIDAEHFFGMCAPFESVEVEGSGNPLSVVTIRARVRTDVASVQDISQALADALPKVAYNHFSAWSVDWYQEATVLRFVTIPARASYYVSGTVLATGPSYPALVASFERDFSELHGPVNSWHGGQ